MHGIRTSDFEDEPSYDANYLIEALSSARRASKGTATRLDWTERGPANVGGRTRAIVVDSRDPSMRTWFAAAVSGGIWKSANEGESWIHVSPDLPNLAFSALTQAASRPDVLYAGSGEGFFNGDAVTGAGIFKSTDGGLSWSQLPSTATSDDFRYVNRIIVSPENENVVIAATREGIFRSEDGGTSWTAAYRSTAISGVLQVIADPSNFSRQYATESGTGVYRSLDGGLTWQEASSGLHGVDDGTIGSDSRIELAIAPSNPQRIYAAVESFSTSERLFTTPNGGDLWILVPPGQQNWDPDWAGTQGWYDNAIAVHPFDESVVYLGGINLYKATLNEATTEIGVLTAFEEENTTSFLDFVSFNSATHFDGRLKTGLDEPGADVSESDFVSVEVRFGPGRSQKAHRFTPDDGPGIPFSTYPYAGYVEVPFEVWDITNNRQLMVSFRDRLDDGAFNLIERDEQNLGREYVVISGEPYSASAPHPQIARTGGPLHKMLYFFWPMLATGGEWNPIDLAPSVLRIRHETVLGSTRTTTPIGSSSSLHVDQHIIVPVVTDAANGLFNLIVGNDGGVFLSRNQGPWLERNNGYNTSQFYGVDKRPGQNQFVGGTQDNGSWLSPSSPGSNSNWDRVVGGDGFEALWNQADPSKLLASIQFNDLRRSVNYGASWSSAKSGLTDFGDPETGGGGQFMSSLARSPDLPEIVFTIGKSGIWKSVNFGASWSLRSVPASTWGFGGSGKVRVSEADGQIVWAGYEMGVSLTGPDDVLGKLHVSTDRGETFQPVPTPFDLASGRFSGLATHPSEPETAYVLFSVSGRPKVLRTTNLGASWEDLSGFAESAPTKTSSNGFPNVAVFDLLVLPQQPHELWAGTEIGVFISRNGGATWATADNGLPAVAIWRMKIVDDQVVVATHGRGVWSVDLSEAIAADAEEPVAQPVTFELGQNYPNPFNPSTTILYSLSSPANVRITVYDAVGREVERLVDTNMPAGSHEVVWNAASRASGVYVVRMSSGSFVQTRLMTLLK